MGKSLVFVGGTTVAIEIYNEIIALARGDKPKTVFTGKYSVIELVRSINKKKKPDKQRQYKHEKNPEKNDLKGEINEPAPKKGYEKGQYFEANNQKFVNQFTSPAYPGAMKSFKEFQNQVLELGVDGILNNNVIKSGTGPGAKDIPKEDKSLKQILGSACEVISGQVPMEISQPNESNPF